MATDPRRRTIRTLFQVAVALASVLPYILTEANVDGTVIGAQILAVAGAITRVMALPQVELFLRQWLPWLAAEPPPVPAPPKNEVDR